MKIKFSVDRLGKGSFFLDDKDLSSHCKYFHVTVGAGEPTKVYLTLSNVDVEGESEVDKIEGGT